MQEAQEEFAAPEPNLPQNTQPREESPMRVGKWMPALLFAPLLLLTGAAVVTPTSGARQTQTVKAILLR